MKLLARLSATNRPAVEAYARAKEARGLALSTIQHTIHNLALVDQATNGVPLASLTPDTLTSLLHEYARARAPSSASTFAAHLKAYYAWLNDDECPKAIRRALKRSARLDWKDVQPLTPDEFKALLRAAVETTNDETIAARRLAILWLLWDTGFRISELLAVRVGDVQFDKEGGAQIGMDPNAPDLKTGPRRIYVVESVGALRTWIATHPDGGNPDAPLFINRSGDARMHPGPVHKLLVNLAKDANLRHVHPHLFRHTRATRAAETGWNEAQLRPYFGWSATSNMATRYVHLCKRNMRERVKRDANLDPLAARIQQDPRTALAEIVGTTVRETLAAAGIGRAPAPDANSVRRDD